MNVLAINANIAPSNRLAIPKIGKWGFGPPEISYIPIIIAHIPRKKELWSIFINILVLCKVTKNS